MSASYLYGDLTDEQLDAKIADLRAKLETVYEGGAAIVVAGEGRRVEYTRSNASGLEGMLKDAVREKQRRAGVQVSGALGVVFPYGG